MPTVKFRLKEPNSDKQTLVYLYFHFDYYEISEEGKKKYIPLKYSTGEKILPKYWNNSTDKQRAKNTRSFPEHSQFNQRLDDIETGIKNKYRELLINNIQPTPQILREELNVHLNKVPVKKGISFFEFVEDFICNTNKQHYTKRNYRTTLNHLIRFQKLYSRQIDFDTIDLDFYDALVKQFNSQNKSLNTIGSIIKNIKVFLNEASDRGLNVNEAFKSKRFRTLSETSESIYLTLDEVEKIYRLDLSKIPRLDRVRDLFIIGCVSGLRFSDFSKLTPENIYKNNDGEFIRIRTTKTNESLEIPMHPYVQILMEKYDGNIPPPISNQKMNHYLKEIGQKAGLVEEEVISQTKGNRKVSKVYKKHELLTTHSARRSFATNLYKSGSSSISIMKVTGHRTEKNFLKYIKVGAEENALELANSSFFSIKS